MPPHDPEAGRAPIDPAIALWFFGGVERLARAGRTLVPVQPEPISGSEHPRP